MSRREDERIPSVRLFGNRPGMAPRRIFGFDSCEGMPEPEGVDAEMGSGANFQAGRFEESAALAT